MMGDRLPRARTRPSRPGDADRAAAAGLRGASMAKIVFCEDSPLIQKLIGLALRSTTHEVHLAADGAEGLALIERERPDLVFTDVSMPNVDGYQLADALKARPDLAHIPIIIMTASGDQEQLAEALGTGRQATSPSRSPRPTCAR